MFMVFEVDIINRSICVLIFVEREMNFFYLYFDIIVIEFGWYICLYDGYIYGKMFCLEVEGCFLMIIFL